MDKEESNHGKAKVIKPKPITPCKSNMEINKALLDWLGPSEKKRAPTRVVLIPKDADCKKWLAYHPDNPDVKFSPSGYYAYVTKCNEDNPDHPENKKIVAWPIRGHHDTCHVALSGFSETLAYAGEVLFSKSGMLQRFDRASGTYNPKKEHNVQAGFPVDKYVDPKFAF